MNALKSLPIERSAKEEREYRVLMGLVEQYLKTGKPVGSNSLKEAGFDDLSSATIRNYFAHLEEEGFLTQQHTSGGRTPTDRAFRAYAREYVDQATPLPLETHATASLKNAESREIAAYMQRAGELLSELTGCAAFLTAPRFDHDYVNAIHMLPIDQQRCLAVLVTDFGAIKTEVLPTEQKMSTFTVKRLEAYFNWKLTGNDRPENLTEEEELRAQEFYNELMVRFIVGYTNFTEVDIYRTGFSKLLDYPEFHSAANLAASLALFENARSIRHLLKECSAHGQLTFWVGEDLSPYTGSTPNCSVIAIPYAIGQQVVGAIGILGSMRMPYRELFGKLLTFSELINNALSRCIYKHKISFRQPSAVQVAIPTGERFLITGPRTMLLEDKS